VRDYPAPVFIKIKKEKYKNFFSLQCSHCDGPPQPRHGQKLGQFSNESEIFVVLTNPESAPVYKFS
jgi:hypothetical protein